MQISAEWTSERNLYRYQVREASQYAMFAMDVDGHVLTWNAGVHALLGYSEEEWIGQHASLIFLPTDRCREVCESEMKLAAEAGCSTDIRWHRRKDGTEIFAHGYMIAIRDDTGALLGFSKIMSDETRNKQLQDSLTDSNMALEQFAYVASHDLQEPLRTIGAFAELLSRRHAAQLEGEAQELLKHIVGGAKRMSVLVADLLALARVQTEEHRPLSSSLDQDLETALTQLEKLIEESRATVTHDPLPKLAADQGQMVRLFQNLVSNSLRYRKPNVDPVVHVSATQQGGKWAITVKDNGIGFDPKFAQEIFAPFRRLHSSAEIPGTGVGLAICRRIVEGHGGRIWAESQPGMGASFSFTLPAESDISVEHVPLMNGK